MTEQDLHDYNKWLTEVWSKQHSNIPFMKDAPNAYLKYRTKQLTLTDVVKPFTAEQVLTVLNSSYELIDAKSFFEDYK